MSLSQALYVHWPYCASKCPYCDFNSHVQREVDEEEFVKRIFRDLEEAYDRFDRYPVHSIFFGGGTPSLMNPSSVAKILDHVHQLWPILPQVEITLEANPSSVENQHMKDFAHAGVNRFSIGIQSLRDDALRKLGRMHTADEGREAMRIARETVERVSVDLIYARHRQSFADWEEELSEVLDFGLEHLSLYQLTIESGTVYQRLFEQNKLDLPDQELGADMFEQTILSCQNKGMYHYEISNFAKLGEESRHNMTYWRYLPYIGVGPGAHGRPRMEGKVFQTSLPLSPRDWLMRAQTLLEPLSPEDERTERLLMGLRLHEGLSLSPLRDLGWIINPYALEEKVPPSCLAQFTEEKLVLSDQGRMVLEYLLPEIDSCFYRRSGCNPDGK